MKIKDKIYGIANLYTGESFNQKIKLIIIKIINNFWFLKLRISFFIFFEKKNSKPIGIKIVTICSAISEKFL